LLKIFIDPEQSALIHFRHLPVNGPLMDAVLDKDDEHVSRQFKPALHISYHAPSSSRIYVLHEATTSHLCIIPSYTEGYFLFENMPARHHAAGPLAGLVNLER
jgi:hypothetical protein